MAKPPKPGKNRSALWRVLAALLITMGLWTITSLSNRYTYTLRVPLLVRLPPSRALVQPVPESINLTVYANGWTLMRLLTRQHVVTINPSSGPGRRNDSILYDFEALVENVSPGLSGAEVRRAFPNAVSVVLGQVSTKRVPVRNQVAIMPRSGFQVVGPVRLLPDSVTLVGSSAALREIDDWPTRNVTLEDVYAPFNVNVPLIDSLEGVVRVRRESVELVADVQETAERTFEDVTLFNRGTIRDTSLRLILRPGRVTVTLRGGVRDLSQLDPKRLVAYINVLDGTDTLGLARPSLMPIPGFSVVDITPDIVRYYWQREIEEKGGGRRAEGGGQ